MRELQPLLQVMSQEKDIHRVLLDISTQKKDVLIYNDVSALNGIVLREEGLVQRARELETQRQRITQVIAGDLGIEQKDLTFAQVIKLCDEPLKREFAALKSELSDIVTSLGQANEANKKLIKTHLDYTSFCIRLLTDAGEGYTYNSKGGTNEEGSANFRVFDRKA